MQVVHDEFLPEPSLTREEMYELQQEVAAAARFESGPAEAEPLRRRVVVGVDQAFLDDRAVSAAVASRGDSVLERVHAVTPVTVPYIPGLLSFREGGPILEALGELDRDPDLVVFDGNGRIHFRQAGLATHLGVVLDVPSLGVAKGLLCGQPQAPLAGLAEGDRVAIAADERVEADPGTVLGYAVQTRQYDAPGRHINPVYVSPGHLMDATTAAHHAVALCEGFKLPEPIRRADALADRVKAEVEDSNE